MKYLARILFFLLTSVLFFGCGTGPSVQSSTTTPPTTTVPTEPSDPYPEPDKLIALTFDDGPNSHMDTILDALAEYDAKATFFVIGKKISGSSDRYIARAFKEGHEIGSHSYSHEKMTEKTETEILEEISKTQKAVADVTGVEPVWYRPPFLAANSLTYSLIQMPHAGCGVSFDDGSNDTIAEHRKYMVLSNAYDGAIALGHVNDITAEVLPEILHELKLQGYEMVTISELFARKGIVPDGTIGSKYKDANGTN